MLSLHENYLSRLFKLDMGISIKDILVRLNFQLQMIYYHRLNIQFSKLVIR